MRSWLLLVVSCAALLGCATPVELQATGGSKGDAIVEVSYRYGVFTVPEVNWEDGLRIAQSRCQAWGYADAQPFSGVEETCADLTESELCFETVVTATYQCVGTAHPLPAVQPGALSTAETTESSQNDPVLVGIVVDVLDGDTIDVKLSSGEIRVRMYGIDAPERDQPLGQKAKQTLSNLVYGKEVELQVVGQDRYDRLIGVVYLGESEINAEMLKQGMSWAYRQYLGELEGDEQYCVFEYGARGLKRGIWALPAEDQIAPWDWRAFKSKRQNLVYDYTGLELQDCIAQIGVRP